MMIRGENAKGSALRLANAIEDKRNAGQVKLVFHRYGERYFLSEVWTGESGRQLLKSRQERAIERELASIPSNVLVLAPVARGSRPIAYWSVARISTRSYLACAEPPFAGMEASSRSIARSCLDLSNSRPLSPVHTSDRK